MPSAKTGKRDKSYMCIDLHAHAILTAHEGLPSLMNGCRMLYCKLQHACMPIFAIEITASSGGPSSSHFQNWRIFGFTRDAISPSIPLLGYSSPTTRFSPFVWLFAAKLLHDNGTELCRDVQALEDEDLALVGYMVVCNEAAFSHRQNLAQGDVTTVIGELLLADDCTILFLQADHVRSFSDLECRKVHT